MPHRSRVAMLRGLDENRIIAGAYVDGRGGVCPMLAAHRGGGRTSLASFARAWDRYTEARSARRASVRELRTLRALLEESLADDVDVDADDVRRAVAEHKSLLARRRDALAPASRAGVGAVTQERPGDPDRSRELARRPGWAWTRLFRRYDHYAATIDRLEQDEDERERAPEAAAAR